MGTLGIATFVQVASSVAGTAPSEYWAGLRRGPPVETGSAQVASRSRPTAATFCTYRRRSRRHSKAPPGNNKGSALRPLSDWPKSQSQPELPKRRVEPASVLRES